MGVVLQAGIGDIEGEGANDTGEVWGEGVCDVYGVSTHARTGLCIDVLTPLYVVTIGRPPLSDNHDGWTGSAGIDVRTSDSVDNGFEEEFFETTVPPTVSTAEEVALLTA